MSTIAVPGAEVRRAEVRRPAASSQIRLTRRGRLVLTALFVALLLVAFTAFGSRSAATREAGTPPETRTVVVAEGDTLWDIAAGVAGPGRIRETVYRIREINALPSSAIVEGQKLAVPVR